MKKNKKLLPPMYLLIYLVAAAALHVTFPITQIVHPPYTSIGIPLLLVGGSINLWVKNIFDRRQTTIIPFNKSSALITEGPFSFSRNPMYLGIVLLLLGVAFLLGSLAAFLAPIAMFITLQRKFIPYEEGMLEETFGKKYRVYKNRVRRWL
ncbi:isoprenylcysteine carboxylmethyltransferase family protein [Patescibacteria group bacterium]|nr:isoprenylcysteine carboxylmethyltransferase family protein [Patescibacteria group bacterium]